MHAMCCKFVSGWSGLNLGEFEAEQLTGGASGAGIFKASASQRTPPSVLYRHVISDSKVHRKVLAGRVLEILPKEVRGEVYFAGNDEHPDIQITEFITGGSASRVNGQDSPGPQLMEDPDDAKAFGRLLGLFHRQDEAFTQTLILILCYIISGLV